MDITGDTNHDQFNFQPSPCRPSRTSPTDIVESNRPAQPHGYGADQQLRKGIVAGSNGELGADRPGSPWGRRSSHETFGSGSGCESLGEVKLNYRGILHRSLKASNPRDRRVSSRWDVE